VCHAFVQLIVISSSLSVSASSVFVCYRLNALVKFAALSVTTFCTFAAIPNSLNIEYIISPIATPVCIHHSIGDMPNDMMPSSKFLIRHSAM